MVSSIVVKYSNQDWPFLNIPEKELKVHYHWLNMYLPEVNLKFPWAYHYDLLRLFFLCNGQTKDAALAILEQNLTAPLDPIHIELIQFFVLPSNLPEADLDKLIQNAPNKTLIHFIHETLERALLWEFLDPCWPGDFQRILSTCSQQIEQYTSTELTYTETVNPQGVYFVSTKAHSHVFYKFQNLCEQLNSGQVAYDLKTLAIQAHEALIKAIRLRLKNNLSDLNEIAFDQKVDAIIEQETSSCVSRILK